MDCKSFNPKNKDKFIYLSKNGFIIYECKRCGHRFTEIEDLNNHVSTVYGDDYFFAGKHGYPNYHDQKNILLKYGLNYARILNKHTPPGRILDIGSAAGYILKGYEQCGWDCRGIEPNDSMAKYGREILNLDIRTGDLESYDSAETFDAISMVQVIGHLHDLDISLQKLRYLLNVKGLIIIESWDMDSLYAKMMGRYWHEYSPPSVVNWFSDKTITYLLKNHGFELISKGRPAKKISLNHGISLFQATTPDFKFKQKLLDYAERKVGQLTLPYPPLDLKWYLFKKI